MKSESEIIQSCLTLCDPMDCSLPGSSVHGIFQAKVLEWGAIAFSEFLKVLMCISESAQINLIDAVSFIVCVSTLYSKSAVNFFLISQHTE